MPFSATFSQQNQSFTRPQPFNQFGISPHYKAFTIHAGYRNMTFSEFTLGGNIFLGLGIEYNDKKTPFKISVLGGRFAKAFNEKDQNSSRLYPSYERWGYGLKVGIEKNNQSLAFMFFKAFDIVQSVKDSTASALGIKPADNIVIGTTFKTQINKQTNVNGEYAYSFYNPDIRLGELFLNEYTYSNNLGGIFTPRQGAQFNSALTVKIDHSINKIRINASYRRVDPNYKTMGSTFLTNDFEDITGGINLQIFKNKLNVSPNLGVQRNNLAGTQLSTSKRLIGGVNLTYSASTKLNLNASFSNFNSSTQLTAFSYSNATNLKPDSLLYLQVTNSLSLGSSYMFGDKVNQKSLAINANLQNANDNKGSNSSFYNFNASLNYKIPFYKLNVSNGMTFATNIISGQQLRNFGPTISASRPILKEKVKMTMNTAFLGSMSNTDFNSGIVNTRLAATYTFQKKHNFSFDLVMLNKIATNNKTEQSNGFTEMRAGLNYGWNF
jgi:hypothetical protein